MSKRNIVGLVSAVGLAAALAGPVRADHHTIKVVKSDQAGMHLSDAKGMALYTFKKDSPGKSACAGPCVANWPVYFREKIGIAGELKESDFGTLTREDGQKQTTYKGMPLYYFVQDAKPGETKGHGVKDVWFLAKP